MADKTLAEIPLSVFEYRANFQEPIFEAFTQSGAIATGLYRSFSEWNIALENITWKPVPLNANEVQIACDLLLKRASFTVTVSGATFVFTNPIWSEASVISRMAIAGIAAVHSSTSAVTKEQVATIAMHLRPQGKSVRDVTARFRGNFPWSVTEANLRGYGFSAYCNDSSWVVDLSAVYPDAVFVRTNRIFGSSISFEDIATALKNDQDTILDILELKVD